MLAYGQSYAMTCDPDDQLANQQGMNEHNWYCGDVHVRGEYPYFAKRLWKELGVEIRMEPEDAETLKKGDKITLTGFGSFEVKTRAAHAGINPKTRKPITIAASKAPVFKAGKALKDAVK